jgi:hypothetical protein
MVVRTRVHVHTYWQYQYVLCAFCVGSFPALRAGAGAGPPSHRAPAPVAIIISAMFAANVARGIKELTCPPRNALALRDVVVGAPDDARADDACASGPPDAVARVFGGVRPPGFYELHNPPGTVWVGLDYRAHPLRSGYMQRGGAAGRDQQLKSLHVWSCIGQLSRFALAAGHVELLTLARDLGPLEVFDARVISEYVAFLRRGRSPSTVYSYLVILKRAATTLALFLEADLLWRTRTDGSCQTWASRYTSRGDGVYVPRHHTRADVQQWASRLHASSSMLADLCSSAKKEREQARARGQSCFRTKHAAGEMLCVMLLWV